MKKHFSAVLSILLTAALLLSLTACGQKTSGNETSAAPETRESPVAPETSDTGASGETVSYSYEFDGMMGTEVAQFDLAADGTCRFFLPDHAMIQDVYGGTYTREGDTVTVEGLTNVDPASEYKTPGLWSWIVDSGCIITVDDAAGTFVPVEAGAQGGIPQGEGSGSAQGTKGVTYASGSASQVCDIYTPEGVEKAPVIVLVHGGGFLFGDAGMTIIQPVIETALENGYAVVSVDYRKSSEAVFPAALSDVKAAVRFVRAHAMEYGFDPEHIAVWGESAGAYLSLMTALTPDVAELDGDVADYAGIPSSVIALVSFYAPVEFYTLYEEQGKPESAAESFESKFLGQDITADKDATYVTYWETYADQIPADLKAWIQAGDQDQRVPYTQSENFASRLADYIGNDSVRFSLLTGADHEDEAFYTNENLGQVFSWLDSFMKG